ncbi:futalosine hydrolase [Alkalihalobacillus pseudalcaliphilus]|uniref:futalosine hydrolase n=1 Tax=Alkalihalobacillus pseudalcaliphilus TaxID=79884 RepID=UPI00235E34B4|nr:futalosine hydrolase [Alkalihalobacillus pseudalcaliphilus]
MEKIERNQRILIMVSVEAERLAVEERLNGLADIDVRVMGVGPMCAAATTMKALQEKEYSLVINLGIGGAFKEQAPVGSVVVANSIIAADLGAESPEGFIPLHELQLGDPSFSVDKNSQKSIYKALVERNVPSVQGMILTVNTTTGTKETTEQLRERYPNAVAEAMEGAGVATAARLCQTPVLEIRTISNEIGPRNREAWKLKEAFAQLKDVTEVIVEVLS